MSSNYDPLGSAARVSVTGEEPTREIPCSACRGLGYVWIQDQESDCIDCEGYGSVVIPA